MTFYWWSHWFWITFLSAKLLPHAITQVHTYPSHDLLAEDITTQQGPELGLRASRLTTKLYQTTAKLAWSAVTPTPHDTHLAAVSSTDNSGYMRQVNGAADAADVADEEGVGGVVADEDDMELPLATHEVTTAAVATATELLPAGQAAAAASTVGEQLGLADSQHEFKRSADTEAAAALQTEHLNNYTNFSSSSGSTNTNVEHNGESSCSNCSNSTSAVNSTTPTTMSSSTAPTLLNNTNTNNSSNNSSNSSSSGAMQNVSASSSTESPEGVTPQINMEWLETRVVDELQKASFTLENVNKADDLRHAENEHRSRKSKELSAEYKHINRYINLSSDTKSLLARSASATPSGANYDAEESNISSEALAIQRTYFLDAGAISAICFTVFGICCTIGTVAVVLYRRRYLNKPQALSEPDSSVYIDDSTMRDNSDEMYSLDNDSFLNSLEAMTIQNYWTDTVKHTKL